ncbi:MAG: hypothetical protein NTX72_03225 [Candidatus Uhrbacteria bacterium]|nr:hypothetical protein [Candidatus Uhrbacteria bacterium]
MFLATRPLERTFSLLETDATYRERNGFDRRLWENLARDLLLAMPPHLVRFARSQNWLEFDGPNYWWQLPPFLSHVVDNTLQGLGNRVFVEPYMIRKRFGQGRFTSLKAYMRELEDAWNQQLTIVVSTHHKNRNRPNDFCITFYATNFLQPELMNFSSLEQDMH